MGYWRDEALCLGSDSDPFVVEPQYDTLMLCGPCPSRQPCLQFGLNTGSIGIWGGSILGEYPVEVRIFIETREDATAAP